jgi:lysophospholipase L1-like esterase
VDGLDVLGPEHVHLLPDALHPNAEGYKVMGLNYAQVIGELVNCE